jgi:hypothetical protein
MTKKFWDSEKFVGEVEKGGCKTYKISAVEKHGRKYVAVSEWKFDEKAGVEKPIGGQAYPVEAIDGVCAMLQSGKSEFSISA